MKRVINSITYITKIAFGMLALINYIFATTNRTSAVLIPLVLWIVSIVINNKTK